VGTVDDPAVTLLDVDELTLDRLVNAAITDAAANEVTPVGLEYGILGLTCRFAVSGSIMP
jgi:hypothetical protein